jgi:DNA-directed RNA polymerase subunit RPC12/RpoP
MITEYISKEVACKDSFTVQTKEYESIEVVPVDYIASLASSKVKPVIYAKWHYYKNNGIKYVFKCTNCGQKLELNLSELDSDDMPIEYNYCFGCGADMEGENDVSINEN